MKKTKVAPKLNKYLKSALNEKVYEYYYTFGDFIDMLGDSFVDADSINTNTDNALPMLVCIHSMRNRDTKLNDICKAIENNKFGYNNKIALYNMIPEVLWRHYKTEVEDYLEEVDEPFADMVNDAYFDFLRRNSMKDVNERYCKGCKHRIKCALKPEEDDK